ncbi:MAG: dihydrolipoyl dehydrogenase [Dehalococcoidia bacterium]|nr:dihydrolipoyl dehydrogenase [Dehalococcoidia bacterium]
MADAPFDVAILGAGTGGYVAAIRGAQLGLNVALIEREKVGGTCLHRGCIPTKALLESAEVLDLTRRSAEFGVSSGGQPTFDFSFMQSRKQKVVDQLHQGVEGLLKQNKVTMFRGDGKFVSPTTLEVTPAGGPAVTVTAHTTVIATGSAPKSLPGIAIDGKQVISSDEALLLDKPPASLIVVGAGAVGVEFASLFNDLGTQVTVVEALPSLVPLEDKDVGVELERRFTARGIRVYKGARMQLDSLKKTAAAVSIDVEVNGKRETLTAEKLLMAVGRGAIVDGIGLEKLNIELDRGYIKVNGQMRTSEPNIYAIGDVNGGMLLAHVAAAEGEHAVEAIAGKPRHPLDYNRIPRCTYTRPQIASLGLSEDQAKERGYHVKTGRFPFAANGRALIFGEPNGFCKIVADADTSELLGVFIIGHNATELIAEAALGRFLEATSLEVGLSVHAHPTLSEVVMEAALDAERRAIHFYRRP